MTSAGRPPEAAALPIGQRHIDSRFLARWLLLPLWCLLDRVVPKRRDCWAFFVHPLKDEQFIENARAVFEAVKDDGQIHKLVFTRRGDVNLRLEGARNTTVLDLQSLAGLWALARCGVYLLTNAVAMDMSWRWTDGTFSVLRPSLTRRRLINLWHGIPLKRLFALTNPEAQQRADRVALRRKERAYYHGLICSSDIDSYAMASIFYPIDFSCVWLTGLPRNDFLLMDEVALPIGLRDEVERVRQSRAGKRLITYAPTFRDSSVQGSCYYQFSDDEIERLKALLRKHDAVLGFRMHYFRKGEQLFNMERHIDGETILDLGHSVISELAPILRESSVVITDYSSVYIDALYLDLPVLSFAYDLEHYRTQQNGLLYDMDIAFPGAVTERFDDLLEALDRELAQSTQIAGERYRMVKKLFFKYLDCQNAQRVVDRIKLLCAMP